MRQLATLIIALLSAAGFSMLSAQEALAPAGPARQGAAAFPVRPKADPAVIARGKAAYGTNCAYCHGPDARGGESGGTNLLRSEYLMKDKNGEVLSEFLRNADSEQHSGTREGVLKFHFTQEQSSELAAFIHDFHLSSRDPGRMRPPTILVGDARAGEAYFRTTCATCHSVAGDLKGIGARFSDPRSLQQAWLVPRVYGPRGPYAVPDLNTDVSPVTVTVTLDPGDKVEGRLGRIDDFIVTLTEADGTPRSFRRDGDVPQVEVHDPLKPHKDLLPKYADADIHNVTAYLVTLK